MSIHHIAGQYKHFCESGSSVLRTFFRHPDLKFGILILNIYTPSVFCYDKHKKNFDIQFSMKRHETV